MKKRFQLIFPSLIISLSIFFSCSSPERGPVEVEINGRTMGTFYQVKYIVQDAVEHHKEIDSVLKEVNQSMSTYIEGAIISRFNQSSDTTKWHEVDRHFQIVFMESLEIFRQSNGAFDPTVMPLVNYWGFGFADKIEQINFSDTLIIDSIKQNVGFLNIQYQFDQDGVLLLRKTKPGLMLDFGAIAKGYGVDAVCWLLESKGIQNYMVEIGGEVRAKGKNRNDKIWKIGIEKPEDTDIDKRELFAILFLDDLSMATSGNYRNYRVINGKKVSHTINPFTGFPQETNILSVTIIADNAMRADGYATAAMVLNFEKAKDMVYIHPELEAFFIYFDEENQVKTYFTSGLEDNLTILE